MVYLQVKGKYKYEFLNEEEHTGKSLRCARALSAAAQSQPSVPAPTTCSHPPERPILTSAFTPYSLANRKQEGME